jgi:flagellar FliL protein
MTAPPTIRAARTPSPAKSGAGAKHGASTDDAEAPAAKKKSKKKLIIIVVVLLLVAGAAYHFLLPAKPVKPGPPKPGAVVALDDTTLNLTDGHFLKIKIALQEILGKGATLDTSDAADIVISEFSNRSMASLTTDAQREAIKADLLKKLEAAYPGELMGVYFTDFVMQ